MEAPKGAGPKVRICYICGRGFGLSSLEIHEKQCRELFIAQQEKLPPNERKKLPERPQIFGQTNAAGGGSSRGGAVAENTGQQQQLSDADLLELQNAAAMATFSTAVMEACPHCGRTFVADRLKIHLRSCTAEKPSRPVGTNHLSEQTASPLSRTRPKVSSSLPLRTPLTCFSV